jgi:hypothetical protein
MMVVCHDFQDAFGSYAGGEASYQMLDSATVSMSVRGNDKAYVHSNLAWMRKTGGLVFSNINGAPITLCWTKITSFPNHSVYAFRTTSQEVHIDAPLSNMFMPSLQDASYYGPVSISGALNERGKNCVPGEEFSLPDCSVYSWGKFTLLYQKTSKLTMLCPKGLVSICAAFMMGKARTPDTFKNLLNNIRFKAQALNMPEELFATSTFGAACLGFVQNIAFELTAMHSIIDPVLPIIDTHTSALDFKFQRVWTCKKVAAAMVAAVALGGTTFVAASALLPVVAPLIGVGVATGASCAVLVSAAVAALSKQHAIDPVASYRSHRASNPPRTKMCSIPRTPLPSTGPMKNGAPVTLDELMVTPMDPTATVCLPDDVTREIVTNPIHPVGIVSTMCVPVAPTTSVVSDLAAVVLRSNKPQPFHSDNFSEKFFDQYEQYVEEWFDDFFPGFRHDPVLPWDHDQWRARFPAHQVARLYDASIALNTGNFEAELWLKTQSFIKIESLTKSTEDGVDSFTPRLIQGSTAEYGMETGPWCYSFSKRLALVWNGEWDGVAGSGMLYTSGLNPVAIGAKAWSAVQRNHEYSASEGDFVRFDSTIHRRFKHVRCMIYRLSGASERLLSCFAHEIFTFGKTKMGVKYTVEGTQSSGRQDTSGGNSVLQGTAVVFCLAEWDRSLTDGDEKKYNLSPLLGPRALFAKYPMMFMFLGDDHHGIAPSSFIDGIPLEVMLLKLGLVLEGKIWTSSRTPDPVYFSTFCSARFWPIDTAFGPSYALASCLGRQNAKMGWYINPPPKMNLNRLLRADAIGRSRDNSMVPFLNAAFERVLELTSDVKDKDLFYTRSMKRDYHVDIMSMPQSYSPNDETYRMMEMVYGLTRADEIIYKDMLSKVPSLPFIVDFEPLHKAMCVDGVSSSPDFESQHLPMSKVCHICQCDDFHNSECARVCALRSVKVNCSCCTYSRGHHPQCFNRPGMDQSGAVKVERSVLMVF